MKKIISVSTGEIKAGQGAVKLETGGIGSCIALAAYEAKEKIGVLAHIMLPGRCPAGKSHQRLRYAADAIDELVRMMESLGGNLNRAAVAIAGGANVLQRPNDTIGKEIIESTINLFREKGIALTAQALGGTQRRTLCLDVARGRISYTQGDRREKILWQKTKPDG